MIGLRQLSHEWGQPVIGRVYADSTAALAIAKRKGCGKLRHINIGELWIQEKVQQNELSDAIREAKVRGSIYGMMGFGVCQCDWIVGSKQCAVYGYAYEQVQQEQDTSTGRQVLAALNASR